MDDAELIKLIEKYPILYDKNSARTAKNAANKDAAWKTISIKLGASERACITRWKSIRDRFGKEFRRFQENPESPTYWDMFPRLLFLKDHYKHGQVKHESLDNMIFEPRHRKPRRLRVEKPVKKQKYEEFEDDTDEIEMCQQLIELVKQHPVLYDRGKIRNSKNLSAKNDAWRDISESLNVSEELCYNRWKKLRDRFAREYRNHQINQSSPITWRYFNDLMFLDRHFRKGVPLIIENIKKRGRPPKAIQCSAKAEHAATMATDSTISDCEHIWGTDYPYSTDNDNDELEDDEMQYDPSELEVICETDQDSHIGFVQMEMPLEEPEQLTQELVEPIDSLEPQELHVNTTVPAMDEMLLHVENLSREDLTDESSTVMVDNVIDETSASPSAQRLIGTVISNMETVLQQSRDCLQILQQAATSNNQTNNSLLKKVQMLLDGLDAEQRNQAERKIVHFLCECQIKTLDGQDIEDVVPCHIFN